MHRRPLAVLAILAALSLAAACSSDDADPQADVSTTTTTVSSVVDGSGASGVGGPTTTSVEVDGGGGDPTATTVERSDGGGDPLQPTDDDPAPGGLPPISAGTPIAVTGCDARDDGSYLATFELRNITDLALEASVEVLFEDAQARPLATAIGEIDRIEPGDAGVGTVASPADLGTDGVDCLLIGLERRELVDGGHQGADDIPAPTDTP